MKVISAFALTPSDTVPFRVVATEAPAIDAVISVVFPPIVSVIVTTLDAISAVISVLANAIDCAILAAT